MAPPLAASTPLLHGEFGSYPACGRRLALTLTSQALHIQRLRPKPEARPRGGLVSLAEVSGCCTLQSRSPSDSAAYLCIYTYPQGRRRRGGRRRAARIFQADGATTYEENHAEAQRWATALMCLLRGVPLPGDGGEATSCLLRPPFLFFCVSICVLCLGKRHRQGWATRGAQAVEGQRQPPLPSPPLPPQPIG
jgi:sphingosine kinase